MLHRLLRDNCSLLRLTMLMVAITFCASTAQPAWAQSDDAVESVEWQDDWRKFSWEQGVLTGSAIAGTVFIRHGLGAPKVPRWIGSFLFDDTVRRAMMAQSPGALKTAAAFSDILLYSLVAYPTVLDPVGAAYIGHGEGETAAQMSLISVQSLALTTFWTIALKHVIGRQRPPIGDCIDDPLYNPFCAGRATVSFPSGHTSTAFTGAALACVHHEEIPLYGGGFGDDLACYISVAAATATGFLRIISNNHYLSDIFLGGALGFASGYFLPKWLHYGFDDSEEEDPTGNPEPDRISPMPLIEGPSTDVSGISYSIPF